MLNIFPHEVYEQVLKDYFSYPVAKVSLKSSIGYSVVGNTIQVGCKLAMEPCINYLFHEMGHIASLKDKSRLLINNYGLSYPEELFNNQSFPLPMKWTAIKNEIRAVIYQEILSRKYGVYTSKEITSWLKSLNIMDDFYNVPPFNTSKVGDHYYDAATDQIIENSKLSDRRLQTMMNFFETEKLLPNYTLEYFNQQWSEKMSFLCESFGH